MPDRPCRGRHRGRQGADPASRSSASTCDRRRRAATRARSTADALAGVGRLVAGASIWRARPARQPRLGRGDLQAFLPPASRREHWIGAGAFTGSFRLPKALAEGDARRPRGGRALGFDAAKAPTVGEAASARAATPAPVFEITGQGQGLRRLPARRHRRRMCGWRIARASISVEHLKRYTTLGMATDQGKTSNVTGLAIMAKARGKPIPAVGTTRFRAALQLRSRLGALAGRALRRTSGRERLHADARLACRARRRDVCRRPVASAA